MADIREINGVQKFLIKLVLLFCAACTIYNLTTGIILKHRLKEDSAIEEFIEDCIEEETGVKIDITPHSPEND
jgi:hypothetical protein